MPNRLTCDDVSTRDLIARYAGGTLSEEDAEALEAHCLECDDCGADLEAAMDLRGVLLASPAEFRPGARESLPALVTSRGWTRRWPAAAAVAATLMLAVVTGWEWSRPREDVSILRGPDAPFTLQLTWQSDGSLRVSWPVQAGATIYRVRVMAPSNDGVSEQVTATSVTLQAETLQRLPGAHVDVQAENAAGEVLARSEPVAAPPR